MPRQSGDNAPGDALRAIREDLDRRNEATRNLTSALTSYLEGLPRDPMSLPNSIVTLADIWGAYAVALYDSAAQRQFAGLPKDHQALFGESGDLYGGTTIAQVKETLATLRVPPGQHWPALNFSREDDSPVLRSTMRELAQAFAAAPYSFSWLLDDEWFMGEMRKRVRERAHDWQKKFDQRFAHHRKSIHKSRTKPEESEDSVVADAKRDARRGILKRYRLMKEIKTQADLARHLGISLTALEGMVRGDRSRYSEERLSLFLKKIGVPPEEW